MPSLRSGSLLVRGNAVHTGEVQSILPDGVELKYVGLRVARLSAGETIAAQSDGAETVVVVISGSVAVASSAADFDAVGTRPDPFSGQPSAVYLPPQTEYSIRGAGAAEIAICTAPARGRLPARLIRPAASAEYVRGEGNAQRRIRNIMMDDDEATSLFVTEVVAMAGNWSSYPPHKHDVDDLPWESQLEEVYYYRMQPATGFGFQRVYTLDGSLDETVTVHDGDAVLVPRGYHVCAAAAGYSTYYLNVLAGPKHIYRMSFDPAHAWIKEKWTW